MRVNRDAIVAVLLLAFCGAMWHASYAIEITDYGTMQSSVWPRVILAALAVFAAILLVRSLVAPEPDADAGDADATETAGLGGWLARYRNALIVYVLFFLFLVTLPTLGMLLGGALFVFLSLTALGRPSPRLLPIHAAVSVVSIGVMWAIFTYGLRVFLPEGEILNLN